LCAFDALCIKRFKIASRWIGMGAESAVGIGGIGVRDEPWRRIVALSQVDISIGHSGRSEKNRRAILVKIPSNYVIKAFGKVESAAIVAQSSFYQTWASAFMPVVMSDGE
jgi:hypothetical protein